MFTKYIYKSVISFIFLATSISSFGAQGFLAKTVTITQMSSTSSNSDAFWVYYSAGGSIDNCAGKVKFQLSFAGTNGTFERAFALATTALVTNKTIEIYSYTSTTDCLSAVSINLLN
ncbi:DUF5992 family protein [Paraglaciecola sp.]